MVILEYRTIAKISQFRVDIFFPKSHFNSIMPPTLFTSSSKGHFKSFLAIYRKPIYHTFS